MIQGRHLIMADQFNLSVHHSLLGFFDQQQEPAGELFLEEEKI